MQGDLFSPIWGWFGQQSPFDFELDYRPKEGVARFLVGTPPILSLLAMESALDLILEAGIVANLFKMFLYYGHERFWNRIDFGKLKPPEYQI